MTAAFDFLNGAPAAAGAAIMARGTELFGPSSRLFLPYLLIAFLIAAAAYFFNKKRLAAEGERNLIGYIFKRSVYLSASSKVDLKVVIANQLFASALSVTGRAAMVATAGLTASFLLGENFAATGDGEAATALSWPTLALITVLVVIASDFTTYWVHRLHHESPVLWPFHKLHHSAETMTPLTLLRKHPVYDLIRALSNAFIVGPTQGIIFYFFGVNDVLIILGVNAVYAAFHWTGSNLRHTHIWLSYGKFFSRIFISPAQHQIHHSCAVRHHDKNYGEIFAVWDWVFGTLYTPTEYETLTYGVGDEHGRPLEQPHPTLKAAYIVPFKEFGAALVEKADADVAINSKHNAGAES